VRQWKLFDTVTRDYILNNFDMLLICWPRFPILAVGQGYSIIDDPVKFESHFNIMRGIPRPSNALGVDG